MKNPRSYVNVEVKKVNGIKCFHFIGLYKLSGGKGTLNFPFIEGLSVHVQIEAIMLSNNMCNNITRVVEYPNNNYQVIYNLPLKKFAKGEGAMPPSA